MFRLRGDAVVMQLVLTGGLTEAKAVFTMEPIFNGDESIDKTHLVAKLIRFSGAVIIFAAITGSLFMQEDEKLIADEDS